MTTTSTTAPATVHAQGATLQSINPATGEVVGSVTVTPEAEIAAVVARARAAQTAWGAFPVDERAAFLRPVGARLTAGAEELASLLSREMGKPRPEAAAEIKHCGSTLDETLDEIAKALAPEVREDERTSSTIYHDPFGVCAAITPWNFPLAMPHWMSVPALVAGNTVVLKPSEETPLIAQAYADILHEVLPPDVLQVVHGADAQGRALVAADVDFIAFTGSRETGKSILGAASGGLKRVILELGGKDPMIVLADADVEAAARFAVHNAFRNAGQVCVSTERIYVHEGIADVFQQAVVRMTGEHAQGDPAAGDVTIGPMINEGQREHVLRQIEAAVRDGATVVAGGAGHHGNFITPTVLTNVDHDMDIMREETFGPVACIMRFRDDATAVDLANDTPFGLGAVVFGGDEERTAAVARGLTAGMIGINKACGGATGTPWVGARQSGFGFHSGPEGHRQFTQARVVSVGK